MCDKHGTRYNVDGWMGEPEDVVVSDVSQSQKVKCHVAPLAWESRRSQIHRDRGGGGSKHSKQRVELKGSRGQEAALKRGRSTEGRKEQAHVPGCQSWDLLGTQ